MPPKRNKKEEEAVIIEDPDELRASTTSPASANRIVEYPTYLQIFRHFLTRILRAPAIAVLGTYLLWPLHLMLCDWVDHVGLADKWVMILGTVITHTFAFYAMAIPFHICDTYGLLQQYRLPHRTAANLPSPALNRRVIFGQLTGHFVFQIPFVYLTHEFVKPFLPGRTPLPPPLAMWLCYAKLMILHEISFYSFHRMFHHFPAMYRLIHKVHHEFVGTTVWATEHTHTVEQLLGSIGAHMQFVDDGIVSPMWFVWLMWRTQDSCEHHGGYDFRSTFLSRIGLLNAQRTAFHDYHHTHPSAGNFGTHLFLDFLMRTSDDYMLELKKQRDRHGTPDGNLLDY